MSAFGHSDKIDLTQPIPHEYVEFPHESPLLEKVAGWAINRRLEYKKQKDHERMATIHKLRFGKNPTKAYLTVMQYVTDSMMTQVVEKELEAKVLENMVEEVLSMAIDRIDTVHKLENSWWKRLVYVFTKRA